MCGVNTIREGNAIKESVIILLFFVDHHDQTMSMDILDKYHILSLYVTYNYHVLFYDINLSFWYLCPWNCDWSWHGGWDHRNTATSAAWLDVGNGAVVVGLKTQGHGPWAQFWGIWWLGFSPSSASITSKETIAPLPSIVLEICVFDLNLFIFCKEVSGGRGFCCIEVLFKSRSSISSLFLRSWRYKVATFESFSIRSSYGAF